MSISVPVALVGARNNCLHAEQLPACQLDALHVSLNEIISTDARSLVPTLDSAVNKISPCIKPIFRYFYFVGGGEVADEFEQKKVCDLSKTSFRPKKALFKLHFHRDSSSRSATKFRLICRRRVTLD